MLVRPTSWGRGKSPWGPWIGLVRGIIVRFRLGNKIKWVYFYNLETVTVTVCVVET